MALARSSLVTVGLAAGLVTAGSAPAHAMADISVSVSGRYSVASECKLSAGYTTDPRFITFVVTASSLATGPSVPVSTTVQCTVYDALDKTRVYGGASAGMVGPYVVAAGQATVPMGRVPAVCVVGAANYLDGTNVPPSKPCP